MGAQVKQQQGIQRQGVGDVIDDGDPQVPVRVNMQACYGCPGNTVAGDIVPRSR